MLKYTFIFSVIFISISAPAAIFKHHFKNRAVIEYKFGQRNEHESDDIEFRDSNGKVLWTHEAPIVALSVNYFDQQNDGIVTPLDTSSENTTNWVIGNRKRITKVDWTSDLVPVADGPNRMWITSDGEIIPTDLRGSFDEFFRGKLKQYRWELPDKSIYRAVVEYVEATPATKSVPAKKARVTKINLIRESDWSHSEKEISDQTAGEILFESDLTPYVNPDNTKIMFNVEQLLNSYKSPQFFLSQMEVTTVAADLNAVINFDPAYVAHVRSLVSEGNGLHHMTIIGQPLERIIPSEEKDLESSIKEILADPKKEFSLYPELAKKIYSKRGQNNLPLELELELASAITRDLVGLPETKFDGDFVRAESKSEIHNFLKNFFAAVNLMHASSGPEFTPDMFMSSSVTHREVFAASYENLIVMGLKSLPRFPAQFSDREFDVAIRLLRMCENVSEIHSALEQVLDDYNISRSGTKIRYAELARERTNILLKKGRNPSVAMSFINKEGVTLDQLKEMTYIFSTDPAVLLAAGEKAIKLSRSLQMVDREKVVEFLKEINNQIPTDSIEYGRFAKAYSDYSRQVFPVNDGDYSIFDKGYGAELRREIIEGCTKSLKAIDLAETGT